jgi:hypothetical protein
MIYYNFSQNGGRANLDERHRGERRGMRVFFFMGREE